MWGVSYKLSKNFNIDTAKKFYYSSVFSVLKYCVGVWGGAMQCTSYADRLIKLHAKIIKNLFRRFVSGNSSVFKSIGILKLPDIHKLTLAMHMYKVIKNNDIPTLQDNLDLKYPTHEYYTRLGSNPILPRPRVMAIRVSFRYQCVAVWNSLPRNIKEANSLSIFKRELTKYFIGFY